MAKKPVNKTAIFGLSALFLLLLFLFLFGAHSLNKTRSVLERNASLEREIADLSYENATIGNSSVSQNYFDEDSSFTVVNDEGIYEPTGFELLGNVPYAYKWLVVFAFVALVAFVILFLEFFKKRRISKKLQKTDELLDADDENDEPDYMDKCVDLSTRSGINRLCDTISTGGIAILPCDTVYGICALVNDVTRDRINEIKNRDPKKNYIILSTLEKAHNLLGKNLVSELYSLWPGPITFIALLADGSEKVAVRVPSDPLLNRILSQTGAIYSTSVNFSGEAPLNDIDEIARVFHDKVDIIGYVEGRTFSEPSTIIDASVFPFKLIRDGAYPLDKLKSRFEIQE